VGEGEDVVGSGDGDGEEAVGEGSAYLLASKEVRASLSEPRASTSATIRTATIARITHGVGLNRSRLPGASPKPAPLGPEVPPPPEPARARAAAVAEEVARRAVAPRAAMSPGWEGVEDGGDCCCVCAVWAVAGPSEGRSQPWPAGMGRGGAWGLLSAPVSAPVSVPVSVGGAPSAAVGGSDCAPGAA